MSEKEYIVTLEAGVDYDAFNAEMIANTGAGDIPNRYIAGKKQLENVFGLKVVETKNALKPSDWIYRNPKARADDLMEAIEDKTIKYLFTK